MSKTKITRVENLTRRDILRTFGACAALTQTSLLSTVLNLSLPRPAVAAIDTSGYKALVCLFFHGGIDSYNIVVPTGGDPYADYVLARGNLALDQANLHGISDPSDGRTYGLHPGLGELQALYTAGNLAFVTNVGSLVEPVEPETYKNGAHLPLGLFSHSDQQRHWQTATPQSRTQITGWFGRMADVLGDSVNRNPTISMNIATGSLNILQTGHTTVPYVVGDKNGAEVLAGYGATNPMGVILTGATDSFLEQSYADLLKRMHARLNRLAIDAAVDYNNATQDVEFSPGVTGILQGSHIGRQFLQVAKAIGARQTLDQDRQLFFVEGHGWDHHTDLLYNQGSMLPEVSQVLNAFYNATMELGVENDVLTFTASDFARTLTANSNNGSDHAWGGNHIVLGGSVNGGRLFGTYPDSLAPGNSLDMGRGRLIPTLSVDEYAAEMAMWFGLENDATLETILPNLRNFYSSSETLPPLGFMS
jgi:uncharacterized protein (DUF1501 family)